MSGISALREKMPQSSLTLSIVWGHREKMPTGNQDVASRQSLNRPVPRSRTCSLQNRERGLSVAHKSPGGLSCARYLWGPAHPALWRAVAADTHSCLVRSGGIFPQAQGMDGGRQPFLPGGDWRVAAGVGDSGRGASPCCLLAESPPMETCGAQRSPPRWLKITGSVEARGHPVSRASTAVVLPKFVERPLPYISTCNIVSWNPQMWASRPEASGGPKVGGESKFALKTPPL